MRLDGSLKDYSVIEILEMIMNGPGKGLLRIFAEGREGIIFIKDGILEMVRIDSLKGREALKQILSWKEGRFILDTEQETEVEKGIGVSLKEILLDVTREIDEEKEIKKYIKSLNQIPFLKDLPEDKEYVELTSEEWHVVAKIDGKKALYEIIENEKNKQQILKIITSLIKKDIIGLSSF